MSRELDLLGSGRIEIVGRIGYSSNATFAVVLTTDEDEWFGIYKPVLGEKPLWDFEPGLHRRERAAFLLSEHLGWGLVPPTVLRPDAPVGDGSVQWYIEADEDQHYFTFLEDRPETHDTLRRLAVFDFIANNTDRKGGHILADADGRLWAIDHGLCFAAEYKVRTVIWDFAGEPIAADDLEAIAPLADQVPAEIGELISGRERAALRRRVRHLLADPVLPHDPTGGYGYPWPLI